MCFEDLRNLNTHLVRIHIKKTSTNKFFLTVWYIFEHVHVSIIARYNYKINNFPLLGNDNDYAHTMVFLQTSLHYLLYYKSVIKHRWLSWWENNFAKHNKNCYVRSYVFAL